MIQIVQLYFQYLVLFLSLGAPKDEAKTLAIGECTNYVTAGLAALDEDTVVPFDDDSAWTFTDIYAKAGCTPVAGSFGCAGATCTLKCSKRICCRWVKINGHLTKVCDPPEIDPSTCINNFPGTVH